ncbi:MAG: shikimate dehydrogenase [Paludibacteraceae bacterium]|jgi:shikimate dehydrogenase|nr:shikimate dehydrogenase [Paludibacteraceae bacterium]
MRHFGIIGKPLVQSFSARYFNEKFQREGIDAEYSLYPLDRIEDVTPLLNSLDGMNVTMPFKQEVIRYLDGLDETAKQVGAVNVICRRIGYNTDCLGFMRSIREMLREEDRRALILGTGGASKAVQYGLSQLGIAWTLVSRTPGEGMLGYDELTEEVMRDVQVIVNTTPLGMYPNVDGKADIPYAWIGAEHLLFDCVYNPETTQFLAEGAKRGARTMNGMGMLYGQAEEAWRIWQV